jgi:formate hydrogenlyase subunit 4
MEMRTILLNLVLMVFLPFLFVGTISRIKFIWAGRKGAPLLQPFYDFLKLLKKGEVLSQTSTSIFEYAPIVSLGTVFAAGLLVPMAGGFAIAGFEGDFIVFAYLLALGKFLSILGAIDTGSSFEGMGASREATFSALVEPAFFIIMAASIAASGSGSFSGINASVSSGQEGGILVAAMAACALLIMMLTEGCRVPVDDPTTHLELTMIHEVMVLDYSGRGMALIKYTAALKMVLICSLLANFLIPASTDFLASSLIYVGILAAVAVLIGCLESLMARMRMSHIPQFVFYMTTLAIAVFFVVVLFISGSAR